MSINGTEVNIGVGMESTPNTPVAPAYYIKWANFSMQGVVEKEIFKNQQGIRNEAANSMIKRKFSQGSLEFVPNVNDVLPFFKAALGSASVSGVVDSAYTHTFTVLNTNTLPTLTLVGEDGAVGVERYAGVCVNTMKLDVSDTYAKLTFDLIGSFPDTSTLTESFAQQTEFAYHNMTVKFGATLTAAGSASATPLKSLSLSLNNNVKVDDAFLSGANTPIAGGFKAGRLSITGSYVLHFNDMVELAKYKANTKNAAIIAFTGALIGVTSTESITIKLGRLVLTGAPKQYELDGITTIQQEFTVEYEATDKEIQIVVVTPKATI